jgi:hypothetical protein
MKKEKFYLFCLKSIKGLKESLVWEYLKNGFLPSELYLSPPPAIKYLLEASRLDPDFQAKIRKEFPHQNAFVYFRRRISKIIKTILIPRSFILPRNLAYYKVNI